jgi:hypothetical protein
MKETIGDLTKLAQSRKQSFFMYKGIPYDITEMYEDEGKWYVAGISDDGEVATQEIVWPPQGTEDKSARTATKQ